MTSVHRRRAELRARINGGNPAQGTFVKLPCPDVIEIAAASGFDFVVVDLEHSTLTEPDAIALVRHADAVGIPALVRLAQVDTGLIARLLENGAAGIQLSTLRTLDQADALVRACQHAPCGGRSVSLANRVAGFGAVPLSEYLALEREAAPVLVGQIETDVVGDLDELLGPLDVAFVGVTDLTVHLGMPEADELGRHIGEIRAAAARAETVFGGWAATREKAETLPDAGYIVVGSDLQLLAAALRAEAAPTDDRPTHQEMS